LKASNQRYQLRTSTSRSRVG